MLAGKFRGLLAGGGIALGWVSYTFLAETHPRQPEKASLGMCELTFHAVNHCNGSAGIVVRPSFDWATLVFTRRLPRMRRPCSNSLAPIYSWGGGYLNPVRLSDGSEPLPHDCYTTLLVIAVGICEILTLCAIVCDSTTGAGIIDMRREVPTPSRWLRAGLLRNIFLAGRVSASFAGRP